MERRRSKRIAVILDAEIILNEISYAGFIENISKEGIFMRILPAEKQIECTTGTKLELKIKPTDEEILKLHCSVIWVEKISPDSLANNIGLEIINPSSEYEDLLKKQNYIEFYS
jgi:hypothetical protein